MQTISSTLIKWVTIQPAVIAAVELHELSFKEILQGADKHGDRIVEFNFRRVGGRHSILGLNKHADVFRVFLQAESVVVLFREGRIAKCDSC